MQLYEKPLPSGKTGNYTLTPDPSWLGAEAILTQSATVNGGATVDSVSQSGGIIQVFLTGITVGRWEIEFNWSTATRSDCYSAYFDVIDC